jgi:TnpA family transposase
MTSIERTAYPRFKKAFTDKELELIFQPTEEESAFVKKQARKSYYSLTLMTLLKCQQYLGYSPAIEDIPMQVKNYLRGQLGLMSLVELLEDRDTNKKTFKLYRQAIRAFLEIKPYGKGGQEVAAQQIFQSAYTMSDPADLINVAIEALIQQRYELPAFSTLDRLTGKIREAVHEEIFAKITGSLTDKQKLCLDSLLELRNDEQFTDFTKIKQTPVNASLTQMNLWTKRLDWLVSIIDPSEFLKDIAHTKVRQFAAEADSYEVGDVKDIHNDSKRYSLLICFIHHYQVQTRDQLVTMLLKRMKKVHNNGREKLKEFQDKYRAIEERIMKLASEIANRSLTSENTEALGQQTKDIIELYGGAEKILEEYKLVGAYHNKNHLPLLWDIHKTYRSALYNLSELLNIHSATQDNSVIQALNFMRNYQNSRKDYLPFEINLDFASDRWQSFVMGKNKTESTLRRKELEVCVFSHLADGLRNGDLFVPNSEEFSDYRQQLLPWEECLKYLEAYCKALNIPATAEVFVEHLKKQLSEIADKIDRNYPDNTELVIDDEGKPHLKRTDAIPLPEGIEQFKEKLKSQMPERHILDILKDVEHWINYTRHFHPQSGSDPKLSDAISRYLFTIFGYGCNLGPSQTARHVQGELTQRILSRINNQHISTEKLEAAMQDVINEYIRFELPYLWGTGETAIADGTQIELRENNLLGERHIRYGGFGGIAYYHISDTYIALFSHFIACGVWEAVHIFDGLLKNNSELQPDTIFADTQGQSEPAFGISYLIGVKLMPRMRNWNDVTFYRPDKETTYKHIDKLFTETVNWDIIEKHWQDLMQVAISIQSGKVLPSMLLQKLGVYSQKNKLYKAFQELGRVVRTIFLLEYIGDKSLRQQIRSETTKIESFNAFCDWVSFGGNILTSGDPVEQEKRVKYINLVANVLMLRNVVDMTEVLNKMAIEDESVIPEMVKRLSPYMTEHIKRFGQYILNMDTKPEPLKYEKLVLKKEDS